MRYAIFLSGFNYTIKYRKAADNTNADFLSRQPLGSDVAAEQMTSIYTISEDILPITSDVIAKETQCDPELRIIFEKLLNGESLRDTQFKGKDHEFMLNNGCVYRGNRVVIPKSLQTQVLSELHEGHIGIVKMKSLARSYCYWFNMDKDIELITLNCKGCSLVSKEPSKVPQHLWEVPLKPWERIHLDFAGPFQGKYFLIVVDAKTKWLEVEIMSSTTSFLTIRALRSIFARFGLPKVIVTDNGSNFTSFEFNQFLKRNNIQHKYSAPGHPASNGQAERFVQQVKKALKAAVDDNGDLYCKLDRFLMQNRKTINSSGNSSSDQMLQFNLRTRMDLLNSSSNNDRETTDIHDPIDGTRCFQIGDRVQFRNYIGNTKWKFGNIKSREGWLHYIIECEGIDHRRHINQILRTNVGNSAEAVNSWISSDAIIRARNN